MLFVLIALWAVSVILLLSDPRSKVMRRLSAVTFAGGAGALSAVLDERIIPYVLDVYNNEAAERVLYTLQAASSLTSYYMVPYSFLLFAAAYHPRPLYSGTQGRAIAFALLIPIAACILLTPPYNEYEPITFRVVALWAVPYILIGATLVATRQVRNPHLRLNHWIVCLAVLPTLLYIMVMNYILPSFGMLRMWVYNTWIVAFGTFVFFSGLFTYGFMGVRVLVDRRRLDSTLRAVTSGTTILNHAIKNDVGKMRLFGEKIRSYAERTNQPDLREDIEVILSTSAHIQQMVRRVHHLTQDLELRKLRTDLGSLLQSTLQALEPTAGPAVAFHRDIPEGYQATVDGAQLREALNNILSNALEAMQGDGEITIKLTETKKTITIEVRDTGPGMSRSQTHKALEPFFTTKSGDGMNFGLGLPYAYHVMRKHGGTLHIDSEEGKGTGIYLTFPKKSIQFTKQTTSHQQKGEVATHGATD